MALQFAAIWWLPSLARRARQACVSLRTPQPKEKTRRRQLLVDVSIIAAHDAGTGIQRTVRCLLMELIHSPPPGFEVRLVRGTRKQSYRYANEFLSSLGATNNIHEQDELRVSEGDVFLGLDLASRIAPRRSLDFLKWRAHGVRCVFVVYDLLPFIEPNWFTPRARRSFRHWLSVLAVHADALFCISSSVATETRDVMSRRFHLPPNALSVGWFHLGATPPQFANAVALAKERFTILMVGTIEPRKGHIQALDAFEMLWKQGEHATLLIVGRPGWRMDCFVERLRSHPEAHKRLLWFSDVNDSQLASYYAQATGLLMASEAEGFGLPLVEAAHYGLAILARDLQVFREVAGNHASYFSAESGVQLASHLGKWLDEIRKNTAPSSQAIQSLTWAASADQLRSLIAQVS